MDADVMLNQLIDAVREGDFITARHCLQDLASWRATGGFTPADPRDPDPMPPASWPPPKRWSTNFRQIAATTPAHHPRHENALPRSVRCSVLKALGEVTREEA